MQPRLNLKILEKINMRRNVIKLKKLMRSRRAISPVISALLLILLSVAAGVVAYAYVMGWLGGATKNPGAEKGTLEFDSIYADATSNKIKIYVRNVGGKDLTLEKIYVDGVSYDNATTLSGALAVHAVAYLEVPKTGVTLTLNEGYFYEVKVTCTDGTVVAQSVEAK